MRYSFLWLKLAFILLITLFVAGFSAAADDTPRINGPWFSSNDNPYWVIPQGQSAPYNRYQCTWYAWGRAREVGWNVGYTGGAGGYWDNASGSGRGSNPAVGAIMCSWSGSAQSPIYHVSYVTSVASNTSWTIAQYNVDPLAYTTGTVTRSSESSTVLSGAGFSSFNLIGFVYPPGGSTPTGVVNPPPYGTPQIGYNANGTMVLGMRGQNGHTYVLSQLTANGIWGSWQDLGGNVYGDPMFGHGQDSLVRFFTYGTDGQIYTQNQTSVNGTSWSGFSSLGGYTSGNPAVASNGDGRIQLVLVNASNGNLNTRYQLSNGSWSTGWTNWGGGVQSKITMAQNADGRLEWFALGGDYAVYNKWQTSVNGDWYNSFGYLGGNVAGKPTAVLDAAGRMRMFVRGGDGYIYYKYQTSPGSGYSGWNYVAGGSSAVSDPAIGIYNGQLYVFVLGTDGSIYYSVETSLNTWTAWQNMNCHVSSNPTVGYNQDGRLQLFCRGNDGTIYSIWMVTGGGWSIWTQMGDSTNRF